MDEKRLKEELSQLKKSKEQALLASEKASLRLPELVIDHKSAEHQLAIARLELRNCENLESLEREKKGALEEARSAIVNCHILAAKEKYLEAKRAWELDESQKIKILIAPFIRSFHWEDDAGGSQQLNKLLPWWELTRLNRKDLTAALLFGIRISLVVGTVSVFLALLIGLPLGLISGYFAGRTDIICCRLIEIWEAMPAFFMLLLIVALLQSKSLFLVIAILGAFSWPHFTRYIRGEVLKQRNLPYVMAAKSLGFGHGKIMGSHILPNAIPPVLTLLPFSMMAAITSEAGLSFLGLGEEGSTSWGVLMAEGRSVFPGESYLLWPPAILLTILLVSIALVGDTIRDILDPKMR